MTDRTTPSRPHYYETNDEECSRHGCKGDAWFRLVSWNGWPLDFCPWCAAEWERDGIAELDEEWHSQPGTVLREDNTEALRHA